MRMVSEIEGVGRRERGGYQSEREIELGRGGVEKGKGIKQNTKQIQSRECRLQAKDAPEKRK
jgi:argonaute-like protein implicated in RNA metabolism and viral defense